MRNISDKYLESGTVVQEMLFKGFFLSRASAALLFDRGKPFDCVILVEGFIRIIYVILF